LCILSLLVRKTTSRPSSRLPIFSKNFILFCQVSASKPQSPISFSLSSYRPFRFGSAKVSVVF